MERCKGVSWCLNLHEVLQFDDCTVIVTDLIYGYDLLKLRLEYKRSLTEIEGRNILQSVVEAVVGMQQPGRKIVHRDMHSKNVMIDFTNIKPTAE